MPAPIFRISNLCKKFGDNVVVNDLSLEIQAGECLGVIGPNGAGKTTTIRMCLGQAGPDSGSIEAFGLSIPAQVREAKKRIGVVTQFDSLDPDFTCAENLRVYGRYFGLPKATIEARVPRLLEFAALQSKANAKPGELSGGMKRRLSLGRALINDPDLILLDEPTTGLDPIGTREMKDLILNLRDQGKTILLCSHQLADVQDVCDRVAILHQGELKELGRVSELLKVQDVTEIHARGLGDAAKAEIADVIRRHGGTLESIDNPTATMEDLFLNIVRESERRPGARRVSAAGSGEAESKSGAAK